MSDSSNSSSAFTWTSLVQRTTGWGLSGSTVLVLMCMVWLGCLVRQMYNCSLTLLQLRRATSKLLHSLTLHYWYTYIYFSYISSILFSVTLSTNLCMLLLTSIIIPCPTLSYEENVLLLSGFSAELTQQLVQHVFIACWCCSYFLVMLKQIMKPQYSECTSGFDCGQFYLRLFCSPRFENSKMI